MKVQVGIIGASGYSGEELLRILLRHSGVHLSFVTSRQHAGKSLSTVFPRFGSHPGVASMRFIDPDYSGMLNLLKGSRKRQLVFLALPHGVAAEYAAPLIRDGVRVIDLSADFRLKNPADYEEFYGHPHPSPELLRASVYGLPEIKRKRIKAGKLIASPGCYPTSILLPLIPLIKDGLIQPQGIVVNSLSGVSGAGRKAEESLLFCECHESVRAYGVPKHRHLAEIEQELSEAAGRKVVIQFTPHLMPVNRGILTSICSKPTGELKALGVVERIGKCYRSAFRGEPFVRLLPQGMLPDTKNVTGTNVIELAHQFDVRTGNVLLYSAEDNLIKGASGQAVQSMNIIFGFPESQALLT